ncbi:hypothetical protein GOB94_07250 [Granulicella sp. 5B5]|uniref:YtcA family lipoprotein n=1 Tax=Granulicella sp. 5B5 TaxID=1617967 RepID=UPI0015F3A655|nr:YtcA family lipoprotein [Granulicella sp. 5B5]QMV18504.1 hypothetical protein GOB94_07250 [Granulicella sp. 5B5]
MRYPLRLAPSFVAALLLTGCSRNPNVEIVGSYFPGWMISLVAGVALTGISHVFLRRRRLLHTIGHPAVIYPAMVVLFTCLLWLCFFA